VPVCGHCGEQAPSSARFCQKCGTALQASGEAPPPTRKTVSIVFSDLVDSTALGEDLDAESLREVLDAYFAEMRRVLELHGGLVEKFIGDAVMAVFGLPRMHEDDAVRAVRAAVDMRGALSALNARLSRERGVTLRTRTGVNTGMVVVGDASGGQRLATGDAVNVAARLEQAAPSGGIVLGPDTFRLVKDLVVATAIGPLSLKGKTEQVRAWQLISIDEELASVGVRPLRPLVGRSLELSAIERRLERAADGGSAESLLLVGEPGVGKSRLAREVVDRIGGKATVLSAACRPYGAASFQPVSDLLSSWSERGVFDHAALAGLAAQAATDDRGVIVDRVAALLNLTGAVYPLEECFWATAKLLGSLPTHRPIVVLLEDLHWAETTLFALLGHLQQSPHPKGTLVLATARPEVLPALDQERSLADMEIIRLSALSSAESDEVIAGVLGGSSLPGSARELIRQAAEGNPLFLEQAVATLIEEGVLAAGNAGWAVTQPLTGIQVPPSISAIFAARLDRLPSEERLVLAAASVAGPVLARTVLESMLPQLEPAELDTSLGRLMRRELLLPVSLDDAPAGDLAFEHASLRDVTYQLSLKSDRAEFHERFADHVASPEAGHLSDGLIGHHLAEAYRYRAELRHNDPHTFELALRGARHLVADCQRILRIGDRAASERLTSRIVKLLTACGPQTGATDLPLMERAAKLLVTMGRWAEAVAVLSPYVPLAHGPLLRDLGVAMCQLHRSDPHSTDYREGQRLLELAGRPPSRDTDALASLAGTWKGIDDERAQAYYRQCLDIDPADPYALGNVVEYEISADRDLGVVAIMRSQIVAAAQRCREQADEGLNLPWAFFDAAKFALLLGNPYAAIALYAKAAQLSTAEQMLASSMASLARLSPLGDEVHGAAWAQRLLALARAVRFPSDASLARLGATTPLAGVGEATPVLILAGGTDAETDAWLEQHEDTLVKGCSDFAGVVVSGGTSHGVAGLAGSMRERYGDRISAIGYLPSMLPPGARVDDRYDVLRRTGERDFSIAESLQAWADLIASGVRPTTVRLLAVNGGEIARAEYRVALGLGCSVGVVVGSGREADRLLEDPDWIAAPNLVRVDIDRRAISQFLSPDT